MTGHRFRVTVGPADVVGVLHLPETRPSPCVVTCHGLGASKDGDKHLLLAREMPPAGLALARFDFRGSGESGGLHRDATIATRIADLEAVLDYLGKQPALDGRFGLLGSSLGGFVASWVAARRAPSGPPFPLVTWNTPASLRELPGADPDQAGAALVAEVRRGEHAEVPAGIPRVLVIQADLDEVVPPVHGRRLFERAGEPKALHSIAGADHRFTESSHRLEALAASRRWLLDHLAPRD